MCFIFGLLGCYKNLIIVKNNINKIETMQNSRLALKTLIYFHDHDLSTILLNFLDYIILVIRIPRFNFEAFVTSEMKIT